MIETYSSSHFISPKFQEFFLIETFYMPLLILYMCIPRAEGSSKIHSRLEQQTSRLSQQMKTNNNISGSSNKTSASSKSSPPKEKTSPASPMDDIERGNMVSGTMSSTTVTFFHLHSCLFF